jgi:hypothetical protein
LISEDGLKAKRQNNIRSGLIFAGVSCLFIILHILVGVVVGSVLAFLLLKYTLKLQLNVFWSFALSCGGGVVFYCLFMMIGEAISDFRQRRREKDIEVPPPPPGNDGRMGP